MFGAGVYLVGASWWTVFAAGIILVLCFWYAAVAEDRKRRTQRKREEARRDLDYLEALKRMHRR